MIIVILYIQLLFFLYDIPIDMHDISHYIIYPTIDISLTSAPPRRPKWKLRPLSGPPSLWRYIGPKTWIQPDDRNDQWEFQDPKMEVRQYHIFGHILWGYSLTQALYTPYIWQVPPIQVPEMAIDIQPLSVGHIPMVWLVISH